MAKTPKVYVVWKGRAPGIYDNWPECLEQVDRFVGAQYKSFASLSEAKKAFSSGPSYVATKNRQTFGDPVSKIRKTIVRRISTPISPALAVDAACSGVPGPVEWQGVIFGKGKLAFRSNLYPDGTNNIGEFLAIVDGIRWLIQEKSDLPIYSDSKNAILWVKNKKCKTTMKRTAKNVSLFKLIDEAEVFLTTTKHSFAIHKWETEAWGENPADFGRK